MKGFRGLKVWQEGKELAVEIYRVTQKGAFYRDFSLKGQLRRAAVSFPSNIAEGGERGTSREAVRFFYCLGNYINLYLLSPLKIAVIGYLTCGLSERQRLFSRPLREVTGLTEKAQHF